MSWLDILLRVSSIVAQENGAFTVVLWRGAEHKGTEPALGAISKTRYERVHISVRRCKTMDEQCEKDKFVKWLSVFTQLHSWLWWSVWYQWQLYCSLTKPVAS